ncbi:HAD-IA family hydrolase [Magnetospirillum sp. UT-4]|uniref:HAD-IA family hydrolase n=1 Tax=Magnetospirillum sp. UT-4 TaxID=2681467 RepID=UPI0013809385|nr:HAD-IA family hydrolase [Magnetospirillum sp. UT-4]CAA7611835.1 Protein CbbY, chromosomal [Magnetospirillum sp. UT-4]
MTTKLTTLIFDVDGTLAETEEAHRQAFNRTFAEFGLPWDWDQALYKVLLKTSGGKERIRAFVQGHDPTRLDAGLDDLIAALHKRKTALYTETVAAGGVPLRPGIAALIEQARAAGLTCAVATTTTRANVLALLDGATLGAGHDWFALMACADDAPVKKPDPQVYTFVLDSLGRDPAECLAIEDSRNGVRAALAAGLKVVVTRSAYTDEDDVTGALAVWPDLGGVTLDDLRGLHARA